MFSFSLNCWLPFRFFRCWIWNAKKTSGKTTKWAELRRQWKKMKRLQSETIEIIYTKMTSFESSLDKVEPIHGEPSEMREKNEDQNEKLNSHRRPKQERIEKAKRRRRPSKKQKDWNGEGQKRGRFKNGESLHWKRVGNIKIYFMGGIWSKLQRRFIRSVSWRKIRFRCFFFVFHFCCHHTLGRKWTKPSLIYSWPQTNGSVANDHNRQPFIRRRT